MKKPGPVAIIGAGICGLSCAQALRTAGIEARLFEKEPRVGGRCATRLWQGHLVDYGVQYFTAQTPEFKKELLTRLRQFRPIIPPILDQDRKIVNSMAGPRFYVLQGNNYFAQVLSRGLDVRLDAPIETLSFGGDGIECLGEIYRTVVGAVPAAQTARLFGLEPSPGKEGSGIFALLEYGGIETTEVRECYGRVLPGETQPLVASYCENHKSGRIIGNKTVFVLQASSGFNVAHADAPQENYVPGLVRAHEELWRIPAGKCTATFGYRWPSYGPRDARRIDAAVPPGAFICGDSHGERTVEEVWLDGRATAQKVLEFLAG